MFVICGSDDAGARREFSDRDSSKQEPLMFNTIRVVLRGVIELNRPETVHSNPSSRRQCGYGALTSLLLQCPREPQPVRYPSRHPFATKGIVSCFLKRLAFFNVVYLSVLLSYLPFSVSVTSDMKRPGFVAFSPPHHGRAKVLLPPTRPDVRENSLQGVQVSTFITKSNWRC